MPKKRLVKILIADDHYLVVEGLNALIQKERGLEVTGIASTGHQVLDLVAVEAPDIILMDINMPDLDGIETTKRIKHTHPKVKILIISMYNTAEFIASAMELGANGYLLKNTSMEELHTAMDVVLDGGTYLSKEVQEEYNAGYKKREESQGSRANGLTLREIQVAKLLVQEKEHEDIAIELHLSVNTILTHRRNIMSKLKVRNFAGLVKFAMNRGWIK